MERPVVKEQTCAKKEKEGKFADIPDASLQYNTILSPVDRHPSTIAVQQ